MQSDDRSFSADTRADIESIVKLAKKASQYQISIGIIATALREYLVRHARGARCRDSLENPRTINAGSLAGINAALREMSGGAVEPITANEITPSKVEGTVQDSPYWRSARARRLLSQFRELRFGPGGRRASTPVDRQSLEWEAEQRRFLLELDKWRPSDEEDAVDYLHQKAILLASLYKITPADNEYSLTKNTARSSEPFQRLVRRSRRP